MPVSVWLWEDQYQTTSLLIPGAQVGIAAKGNNIISNVL